jgi:hypothetical protein
MTKNLKCYSNKNTILKYESEKFLYDLKYINKNKKKFNFLSNKKYISLFGYSFFIEEEKQSKIRFKNNNFNPIDFLTYNNKYLKKKIKNKKYTISFLFNNIILTNNLMSYHNNIDLSNLLNYIYIIFYNFGKINIRFNDFLFLNFFLINKIVDFFIKKNENESFKVIKFFIDFDKDVNVVNGLLLKNTLNLFFKEIQSSFYRVNLNFFDYFYFSINNVYSEKSYDFKNEFIEIFTYTKCIPVFFSKNIFKIAIGEEPNFGIFSKLSELLDIFTNIAYLRYYYPVFLFFLRHWIERPLDIYG